MQTDKHYIRKTDQPKEVVIIGGGIGGMETARVLKLRGHRPIIYEADAQLGGTFIPASAESYKGKLRDLLAWYRKAMKDLDIEIHLNSRIEDLSRFEGKDIVIATGALPRKLDIPGFDKTIEACDYLNGTAVGNRVAVIGGGLTGCEIAYELALQGKQPCIIEMQDDLIKQTGVCLANSSYLREWFELHQIPVYLNTSLKEVKDGSIICLKEGKEIRIECDSVISSVGYIPSPIAQEKGRIRLVGDCKAVGNLRSVIWRAYEVAMKI
jgi:2-enoate reductase